MKSDHPPGPALRAPMAPVAPVAPVDWAARDVPEADAERWFTDGLASQERSGEIDFMADLTAAVEAQREWLLVEEPATRPRPGHLRPLLALAALAAAVLVWVSWPAREDVPRIDSAAPAYIPASVRGPGDALEGFTAAMRSYEVGEYAAAEAALTEFLSPHPGHGPARFYRAACLEQLGRRTEAGAGYDEVARGPSGMLADHARWRRCGLHLRAGEVAAARRLLDELAAGSGAFARNAQQLLDELEE